MSRKKARAIALMDSKKMLPLTEKILNRVVTGLSEIKTLLPRDFRLAVNVTPALLAEREFTQMCLALAGHDSILLVLELTEQQPFNMDRRTEEKLSWLCDAGVAFAYRGKCCRAGRKAGY